MNGFDHERWLTSMNELSAALTSGFREKFGYPPGKNEVTPAAGPLPEGAEDLPTPLVEFFRHVEEVSLPDLHTGVFITGARHTVSGRDGRQPVRIDGPEAVDVVTFAADGGGTLFALGLPDGAPVYRLPPSALDRAGVYDNHDSRAQVVAATLPEFLTGLHDFLAAEITRR
ncbi:hypothetical protein ACFOWZ_28565 [Lentzea rhizosphaerae]|uniref:SMI1 / KNR4 family (SUKH-1) n=1 Tax=Lentzea rhizosphaerae TaxID=2041025 RepID=A0ABV8C0H9_9PSEU